MVEEDKVEDIEFKWGKKRGRGGKKKEIQFYESFNYDGIEYILFDCVYLYKEGESEPYIGKLLKIWEQPDEKKRVKILWFFRPCEILNYLGVKEASGNELFLASGEGVGLANVNPLEAIAGKCNVVCTSKDSRNRQPTEEELHMADFVFYRIFDVGKCTILEKIDEKIAGVDVKFLFNTVEPHKASVFLKLDSEKKEVGGNVLASNDTVLFPKQNTAKEYKTVKTDGTIDTAKENACMEASLDKKQSSFGEKPVSGASVELAKTAETINGDGSISGAQTTPRSKVDSDGNGDRADKVLIEQKSSLGEKPVSGASIELAEMAKTINREESILGDKTTLMSNADPDGNMVKGGKVPDSQVDIERKVRSAKESVRLDNRPFKKVKLDSLLKQSENENINTVPKLSINSDFNDLSAKVPRVSASEDNWKRKLDKDSHGTEGGPSKKFKLPEKLTVLSDGKVPKASLKELPKEDKVDWQVEVTRRPDAYRSKWFTGLPWEDRMKAAHEQETLVLLQNLDPAYTSAEVEDIVWHGFKQSCTAKMIQRTAFSSPRTGQALLIFKTREVAETVVRRLDEGCLILSNGRPLVGSFVTPCVQGKRTTFYGHLVIDRHKLQMQREMKQAVSTSHCSQPNTVEYEMAMEWCLHQERFDCSWKKLFKQQGDELRKLKANLKSK